MTCLQRSQAFDFRLSEKLIDRLSGNVRRLIFFQCHYRVMTLKNGADFDHPVAPASQNGQSRTEKMSDKLKSVVVFGSVRMVEAGDKLQFVGHLLSLPAVSRAIALQRPRRFMRRPHNHRDEDMSVVPLQRYLRG